MSAAFNKGATLIALKEVRAGSRTHLPGDHFAWRRYALTERRVAQLLDQRIIAELTQESFDIALARRAPEQGVVPHGFTRDGLGAMGIEVPDQEEAAPAASSEGVGEDYDTTEERDGFTVCGRKMGVVTAYDVFHGDKRLNVSRLRGEKQLNSFLEELVNARVRSEPKAAEILEADPNTAALVQVGDDADGYGE